MPLFRSSLPSAGGTLTGGIQIGNRWSVSSTGGMDWASASGVNDVNLYRAGVGVLQTDYSVNVGGTLLVSTGGTAINAVDRGATTNFAAYVLRTATADMWSLQMLNNSTNNVYLSDSANSKTAFMVVPGAVAPNLQLLSATASHGGGVGVIGITNASTVPATNPSGGGVLYAESGALKWRGSGGTITTLGAA